MLLFFLLNFFVMFSAGGFTGEWKSLMQAKEEKLGTAEVPDYYITVASLMSVRRENCYYLACPTPDCKKKVSVISNT
jgi:replication factor A1